MINNLIKSIMKFLSKLLKWEPTASSDNTTEILLKPPTEVEKSPMPIDTTPPVKPLETSIKRDIRWRGGKLEDRLAMYDMVNRVCAELAPELTKDIQATIAGESGWNQWCINEKSKDYGIAQFSAYYYLKEYKMTPEYACEHPEECVRIMVKNFKNGRASNWVAYQHRHKYYNTKPV